MKYKEYLIKKGELDLLSSLQALDKKILNKKLKEFDVKDVYELKEYIIENFRFSLEMSNDDPFTIMYFERLIDHENTEWMSAYDDDIEDLIVFVYNNKKYNSYYIPTEIKKIINELLFSGTEEEKFNLRNAANTPIIKDLKGLLKALTAKDLRNIGNLFIINRLSKKVKKELVNIIYGALTNEEKITDVIERLIDKEFSLLKRLMTNKGTIQDNNISPEDYYFLYATGIVFLFRRGNKFYISITDDVYNTIKKINLNKLQKIIDENTKVYSLVRSMVELYGIVSSSELDYYYSMYYGNGKELEAPSNSLIFCERLDNIGKIHKENNLYYVNKIFERKELELILNDIIERQSYIKKKTIKLNELLKYYNYDYYEKTESKNNFKKYLKKLNVQDEDIEEILKIISDLYRLGNSFAEQTLAILAEYGIEIEEKNLQEIVNHIMAIYNNSKIWQNNGWTPMEMALNYDKITN